jgi:hypothetical protein
MEQDYYSQNIVFLHLSDEADTGSGGDQPARNILTGWNRMGRQNILPPSQKHFPRSSPLCLRKRIALKKQKIANNMLNKSKKQQKQQKVST